MALAALLGLGAAFFDPTALVAWAVLLAVFSAALFDVLRLGRAGPIAVQRTLPAHVGLGESLRRAILLSAPGAAHLDVEVREAFPSSFVVLTRSTAAARDSAPAPQDPGGGPDGGRLDSAGALVLLRHYRAERRGVMSLGEVRVRLRGPLGLVERESRFPARQELRVQPALAGLARTLRLVGSERWRDLGLHRFRRAGGQMEFESLRDYVPGDERRHVDWKATARRGRPTVRQHDVERGQELWLLIDCGRRMDAREALGGSAGWSKLDHALDAALELGAVALSRGERVGALAFDDGLRAFVPSQRGRSQFLRLKEALFDLKASSRESDLARALREVAVRSPRRALVLVVSEVADPLSIAGQCAALSSASRRHRVVFAALDDPDLAQAIEDEVGPVQGVDRAALRAAAFAAAAERDVALNALRASGARILRALPAQSAGSLLTAWLDERVR